MTDGGPQRTIRDPEFRRQTAPDPEARCAELEAALDRAVAERDAWAQELFESNRFAAELVSERQMLADDLATVTERELARANEEVLPELEAARHERDRAVRERDHARHERGRALDRAQAAEAMLDRVTHSTSWRLTAPVRALLMALLGRPRGPS